MPQAHPDGTPDGATAAGGRRSEFSRVAPELADAVAALAEPGMAIVAGPAGCGRTRLLTAVAAAFRGPVYSGGGLSMLRGSPGLALTRAVRAKLPAHDVPLCAEAVRSRVRGGLLVVDDLQWCDAATLAALPHLAATCRVVAALRTPHRLPESAIAALRQHALWIDVAPVDDDAAAELVRAAAPGLPEPGVTALVRRGGGNPLALESLARRAQARPDSATEAGDASPDTVHALAEAVADLPRA
ncbi:MAG: hypothetical protein ACRDXX_03730, partial [Stackebrandtia sp.]